MTPALVIHVPHSSTVIPTEVRRRLVLSDDELARELLLMTDSYTDELFALPAGEALTVTYPVSRLVCDPERFEDDEMEVMAARGMGVIYTATHDLGTLRAAPSGAEREALLEQFYRPHHARLTAAVAAALAADGECLLIDAHSFPSAPLPYEDDQRLERPAICLGTDPFHTPPELRAAALAAFAARFGPVAFDRPFTGALVPAAYYRRDASVRALMVEVRRDLYMDEATAAKLPDFAGVAERVRDAVGELTEPN
jgi:N-formylglutamate deformylase